MMGVSIFLLNDFGIELSLEKCREIGVGALESSSQQLINKIVAKVLTIFVSKSSFLKWLVRLKLG